MFFSSQYSTVGMLVLTLAVGAESKKKPAIDLNDVPCVVKVDKKVSRAFSTPFKKGVIFFSSAEALKRYQKSPAEYEGWANYQLVRTGQYEQNACPISGEPNDEFSSTLTVAGVQITVLCGDCVKEIGKLPVDEQIESYFGAEPFKLGRYAPKKIQEKSQLKK